MAGSYHETNTPSLRRDTAPTRAEHDAQLASEQWRAAAAPATRRRLDAEHALRQARLFEIDAHRRGGLDVPAVGFDLDHLAADPPKRRGRR